MARPKAKSSFKDELLSTSDQRDEQLERQERSRGAVREAREYVLAAAQILRSTASDDPSRDYERVAWILEDALIYLDRPDLNEERSNEEKSALALLERLNSLVNAS